MSSPFTPQPGGFTQPSTSAAPQTNGQAQAAPPSDEPVVLIDPNDPRLTSEERYDTNADSYAEPPPPPDRLWRAKLKLEELDVADRWHDASGKEYAFALKTTQKEHLPYFAVKLSAQIIDPSGKFDGIKVYPAYGGLIGTLKDRQGGSKATTLLNRLKKPDGSAWVAGFHGGQRDWIELLVKALAGEPEVGIETQWTGSCRACGEIAQKSGGSYPRDLKGMGQFPQELDVEKRKAQGHAFSPEAKCLVNAGHGYFRARAIIARFLHLSELPQQR